MAPFTCRTRQLTLDGPLGLIDSFEDLLAFLHIAISSAPASRPWKPLADSRSHRFLSEHLDPFVQRRDDILVVRSIDGSDHQNIELLLI